MFLSLSLILDDGPLWSTCSAKIFFNKRYLATQLDDVTFFTCLQNLILCNVQLTLSSLVIPK